jgi:hypothetical protein
MWTETLHRMRDWRRLLAPHVIAAKLDLGAELKVVEPHLPEIATATVVDGLETFREHELSEALRKMGYSSGMNRCPGVTEVDLIVGGKSRVRESAPLRPDIQVFHGHTLQDATLVELPIPGLDSRVTSGNLPIVEMSEITPCRSWACAMSETNVHEATRRMRSFPHIRRAINSNSVGEEVRATFLREAEASNGINPRDAEVLAVFQNVPLSLISRFRLVVESNVLLYTISDLRNSSRARVHDVAAVRDKVRNTTHLVAHRTRYRTANLA